MLKEPGHYKQTVHAGLVMFVELFVGQEKASKWECGLPRGTWQEWVNCNLKSLKLSKDLPQTVMHGRRH